MDEPSEWDRDGQYFHYLTKWMDALERMARVTGDLHHLRHAVELADVAHRAFLVKEPGRRRIHWKMSIDLSRPLVPAMGRQDALDGLATYGRLEAARRARADAAAALPDLRAAIEDFHDLCRGVRWETDDELGIGGLLMAATALMDLVAAGDLEHPRVLDDVLADAERSLRAVAGVRDFRDAAGSRLAFRELGLAIGLQAAESMREALERGGKRFKRPPWLGARLRTLASREDLGGRIRTFWIEPAHRQGRTWTQHQHINAVMLAASLVPEVCLGRLGGLDARSTSSLARERTP